MATTARVSALVAAASSCIPEEPRTGTPSIAPSLTFSEESEDQEELPVPEPLRRRRASTRLIAQSAVDIQRITGESTAQLIQRCCGGGCCMKLGAKKPGLAYEPVALPDNNAFKALALRIGECPTTLTSITDLPEQSVFFENLPRKPTDPAASPVDSAVSLGHDAASETSTTSTPSSLASLPSAIDSLKLEDINTKIKPPTFVQPHPPYHVYAARIDTTRELTKPGAEKRTFHFDLDISNYPEEDGVDFKVGGAIGVMAPNDERMVDDLFDALMVPRFLRDKPVVLKTTKGRWPTVWGDEKAREMVTTRRDLLTWCSDIQSYPPTKTLLRVLAEHAADEDEKKILMFLCSAEGQGVFCDFRTGPHVTVPQLLHAFPSSHPPLDLLLSVLQPLMPRFYSLSNDPHESFKTRDGKVHRLVEIAVTVHETSDWRGGNRTGIGSGFFERQALKFLEAQERGEKNPEFYIPMFKGLMANPLAKQFVSDGPMLLIGAGVGIAPFRGFVQRRLKTANCANKVWVLQGIRDSLVDEIYNGEWGVHEDEVKRVIESRKGEGRYVQEEVRHQADLVWYIANAVDGRVFVCGSSKGMGEGVEEALVDVAMQKGNLARAQAQKYWELKKEAGQYIAETW
ncbi:sulfite reductase flavoprotein alpha-component [Plectosphaerella cucumerina]|jgi:sulfite reductase alpha subunit-like flavoprotein|uniref:Sulfite reductase flavoprotein alpha-component n=1 Tax=Plectosphaerella cucumerina TaxID=40658 RepID=A0A8K0X3N6_9PEZI|nr:sulfite reductase flavoprotein alpha-component [Plectosphaerella cucumerina]